MASGTLMKMVKKCIIYPLALFYSLAVCFKIVMAFLAHPGKRLWHQKPRPNPPPCLTNAKYGKHQFVKVNNTNIHYVEKGDRNKPLMLFIHGFPEFWFSWRHQLEEHSKDYWTVAMDLRGFGESQRFPDQSSYYIKDIVEDVHQLVKHLGKDKFILVAHDWGGIIAWNFLDLHHEMVSKYIIMGAPYIRFIDRVFVSNLQQFLMSWYISFFQMPILPELMLRMNDYAVFDNKFHFEGGDDHDKDIKEAYKYTFSKPGAVKAGIDYYRANLLDCYLIDKAPEKLPEGLFILGENEKFIVRDHLDAAKKDISNVQTLVLKDCDHFLQQTNPDLLNAAMRSFLNKTENINI